MRQCSKALSNGYFTFPNRCYKKNKKINDKLQSLSDVYVYNFKNNIFNRNKMENRKIDISSNILI